jgi:hypothetical protein
MSFYTQAEYDAMKTAYIALQSGSKVVQVSIGGKFIRYQDIQIKEVKGTLDAMAVDLGLTVARAYASPKGRFD